MKSDALPGMMRRLWRHIGPARRLQYLLVLAMMLAASLAEVVTIGAVLPFLMALTAPEKLLANPALQPYIGALGIASAGQLVGAMTAGVAIAAILAGALRVMLLWFSTRLSCATGADISIDIYRRTLHQPYLTHVARNTSEIVAGVTIKTNHVIGNVFGPALTLVSSAIMLVAVIGVLVTVDFVVAVSAFLSFGVLYGLMALLTRKRLVANSRQISVELDQAVKSLNEGLGGIRDVLIDGTQETYCEEYHRSDLKMRRAQASLLFISQCPRYMIEAGGMVLVAVFAYLLSAREGGLLGALPVLGALVLGAQRLLPLIQQAFAAWTSIFGGQEQLRDTLELLDQPLPESGHAGNTPPLPFAREIRLENVSFRYDAAGPWVLQNVGLSLAKGSRVGFMGKTGSGKSTLLDLIMGLLPPSAGVMMVDGVAVTPANQRQWQGLIAHVPQAIFLADRTIAENIALGQARRDIDLGRVREAARQAQMDELICSWPKGYDTVVGERGIRLSGGQRQRIGIARALYKRAEVIIFDEATSALDNETEDSVMKAIENLGSSLTVLIIAHRLSTLRICDKVVELGNQGILRSGTYAEIVHIG